MVTSSHIELEPEHLSAIQALANETHQPVDDINRMYTEIFERLDSDARVKDFLVLLTSKSVREELRHTQSGI